METNTENLKSKAMKNEFAIKCNTWEEACELFELAQDYGYRHGKGSEFCRERFKQFQGIIEFFKSGRFCQTHSILNPHPYSKQKAIELLSGQESPSIQWVHVNNRDTIIPETIMEFTFTDDKVIKTDHKGIAKELYSIAEGEKYFPLIKEYIDRYTIEPDKNQVCNEACSETRTNPKPHSKPNCCDNNKTLDMSKWTLNGLDIVGWQKEYATILDKYRKAKKKLHKANRLLQEMSEEAAKYIGIETTGKKYKEIIEYIRDMRLNP